MSNTSGVSISCVVVFALAFAPQARSARVTEFALEDLQPVADVRLVLAARQLAARGLPVAAWQAESIDPAAVRPWPIADWVLAELPDALEPAEEGVRALVARLSERSPGAFVSPVFVGLDGGPVFVTPVLLVGFDELHRGASARKILAEFEELRILAEDWAAMPGSYKLEASSANGFRVLELAEALAQREGVRYAEPDWIFTGRGGHTPNDPSFSQQWGLHNTGQNGGVVDMDINAPEAWDITEGDASLRVVVIDTGVQQDHPDITQIGGVDLTSEGPGSGGPVNSWDRHGTPVAGCVSATIDNALGVAGAAPRCSSVSARTFISIDGAGNWTSQASWTVDALTHAQAIGARVTNNSNGYGFTSGAIASKYQSTRAAGMVHFASAGNDSSSSVTYPASLPAVLAIGSITSTGALSSFSNYGSDIVFTAPGSSILSTDRTGSAGYSSGDFATVQGTSFASPTCAGVAALVLSLAPGLGPDQVEIVLRDSVKDLGAAGFDTTFGWGLVDAHAALASLGPCTTPTAYCSGLPNSVGPGAAIGSSGTVSISSNDLVLYADLCPPSVFGLFYYGPLQTSLPLGDGLRCVDGALTRLAPRQTDTLGSASQALDLSVTPFDAGNGQVLPGTSMNFQFWYRDLAAGGAGSNLSDALSVTFCN
jgi:subtilisin family serine protease